MMTRCVLAKLTVSDAADGASAAPSHPSPGPGARKGRPAHSGTKSGKEMSVFIPSTLVSAQTLPRNIMLPYLHEHFDMLVLPQEISAERHPL